MCLRCGTLHEKDFPPHNRKSLWCSECLIQCFTCGKRVEKNWQARTRPFDCNACKNRARLVHYSEKAKRSYGLRSRPYSPPKVALREPISLEDIEPEQRLDELLQCTDLLTDAQLRTFEKFIGDTLEARSKNLKPPSVRVGRNGLP